MKFNRNILRRPAAIVSAIGLLASVAAPAVINGVASASNQVTGRSISMSDSTPDATNVTYALTITVPDASQSLIVDFCQESPIIGGACTTPVGFDASGAAYSSSGSGTVPGSGGAGAAATGFSLGSTGVGAPSANHLAISSATATTAATKYTFYFTGIHNPTGVGTFYARVYTFTNATYDSGGTGYATPAAPGDYVDYGGFALSTANNVTITAIVMESITFCVSKLAPGPGCGTSGQVVTTPALTLGHGTPQALGTSAVDTDTAFTQLSTNALSGAVISLKTTSSTTCAGLSRDGGTSCGIPGVGGFGVITAGTANFGLNVADGTGGTGTVTHNANYGTTAGSYGMGSNATSTYGDPIESSSGATDSVNSQLTYAATASSTTPAGVYTTTEALIATGTF